MCNLKVERHECKDCPLQDRPTVIEFKQCEKYHKKVSHLTKTELRQRQGELIGEAWEGGFTMITNVADGSIVYFESGIAELRPSRDCLSDVKCTEFKDWLCSLHNVAGRRRTDRRGTNGDQVM